MANPNLTMPKLKRAFQLLAVNVPQRTICEQLHMGRGVLSKYKKAIRDYQYSHNLSYHNIYLPGAELQIDLAGDSLWLTDPKTGERTSVVVLVCVLPYSGLGYAKALQNASMEHFFGGQSDASSFYGGTTRKAKSDNMKQWFKKHDHYEPML